MCTVYFYRSYHAAYIYSINKDHLYNFTQIHAVYLIRFYQGVLIDEVNRRGSYHVILIYLINSNRMNRVIFFYAVY